jgi:murein DD-endopeptidase MepM/ murein hydrolase activator NlpD
MGRYAKWLVVILLPLMASCSSTFSLIKKISPSFQSSDSRFGDTETDSARSQPREEGVFHIVGSGESLRQICEVYGLDLARVARINKISAPYSLKKGDTVFLPSHALLDEFDENAKLCASKGKKHLKKCRKKKKKGVFTLAKAVRGKKNPHVPALRFPVPGGILTSPFGNRWGRFHKGLDIAAPIGRRVLACAGGRVVFTGSRKRFRRYGRTVLIDHGGGVYTHYAHLKRILCRKGDRVKRGQKIALLGNSGRSTGPHLHLEVRVRNQLYNPLAYFASKELSGIRIAKRFADSPMGPVRAHWRVPELIASRR